MGIPIQARLEVVWQNMFIKQLLKILGAFCFITASTSLSVAPLKPVIASESEPENMPPYIAIPTESRQLMLVISDNWQAVQAKIYRFERPDAQTKWNTTNQPIQAVLGKKGMGWGRGLHRHEDTNGDYRVEFDKRSPAGIFTLGTVFGLATPKQAKSWLGALKMPYLELAEPIRCVGDHDSSHYNELLDITRTKSDWRDEPNENMREIALADEMAYQWGVFINHNINSTQQKKDSVSGSCIFLHIWKEPTLGTAGCTAMTRENMVRIIRWLNQSKTPILVQLPRSEYVRLKDLWHLPQI